jgi:hypothetical protein
MCTALLHHVYVSASREQLARIDQHGRTVLVNRVHLVPPACQPGTFLDQAMSDQAAQPVIECLPGTFRVFQPHELVQLIAGTNPDRRTCCKSGMSLAGLNSMVPFS